MMKTYSVAFVCAGLLMLVIDAIWLSVMARQFYRPMIGELLADQFRIVPAVLFYLLYVSGIVYFGVRPALADGALTSALINGALLGLLAYGTYDLTNQATLKVWPPLVTVVDLIWGMSLTAAASAAGYLGARWASQTA